MAKKKAHILLSALEKNWLNEILIKSSIEIGRFDKTEFNGLENTVLLGEDQGLYALINSIDTDLDKKMLEMASSSYFI